MPFENKSDECTCIDVIDVFFQHSRIIFELLHEISRTKRSIITTIYIPCNQCYMTSSCLYLVD